MIGLFLKIIKIWGFWGNRLINWLTLEQVLAYRIIKTIVVLAGLFLASNTLGLVLGLSVIYLPRICAFLVLSFLIIPPVLFFLSIAFSKISIEAKIIAFVLSVLLALIEFGVGMFGGLIKLNLPKTIRTLIFPNNVQFPLSDIRGITVDSDSNIYLAISDYSRIQKYNNKGEFITGWFVNTGGVFNIWVINDHLHAILSRKHKHVIFDLDGRTIEEIKIKDINEELALWEKAEKGVGKDQHGNIYLVEYSSWVSKVIKINSDGVKSVIIKNPFYFRLISLPHSSWFLMIIGLLMSFIFGGILKYKLKTLV